MNKSFDQKLFEVQQELVRRPPPSLRTKIFLILWSITALVILSFLIYAREKNNWTITQLLFLYFVIMGFIGGIAYLFRKRK